MNDWSWLLPQSLKTSSVVENPFLIFPGFKTSWKVFSSLGKTYDSHRWGWENNCKLDDEFDFQIKLGQVKFGPNNFNIPLNIFE